MNDFLQKGNRKKLSEWPDLHDSLDLLLPQLDHEGVGSFLEALFILSGLQLVLPGFHFVSGTLVPLEGGLFGGAPEAASLLSLLNQGGRGGPLR